MGRLFVGVLLAAFLIALPAHADTSVTPIDDPYADTLQLWSNIISTVEALAHDLATSLVSIQPHTANSNEQNPQRQHPSGVAQSAAAVFATPSNPNTATSGEITTEATSDQTTLLQNVKSAVFDPSISNNSAAFSPTSPIPTFVTQDELNAQLLLLSNALTAKFSAPATSPVPQYIAAGGNNENPFAAGNAIDQLNNVTITNANLTASEIPDLSGQYLSLNGGTLSGALIDSSTAPSTFAGDVGIGTPNPQAALDLSSSSLSEQSVLDLKGTDESVYGEYPAQIWEIADGSISAPVTTAGSTFKLSRYDSLASTTCSINKDDSGCDSALEVSSFSGATGDMITSGILAGAESSRTAPGSDAIALSASGRVEGSGTGIGTGAYLEGFRNTTTGMAEGAELTAWNDTSSDCSAFNTTGFSQCTGAWIAARGNGSAFVKDSVAVAVGSGDGESNWLTGLGFTSNSVASTTIDDESSANTSLMISGNHTNAIAIGQFAGDVGIGTLSPAAKLEIANAASSTAWLTNGIGLRIDNATYTDTSSSGSVGNNYVNVIGQPTLAASNPTTYSNSATLYVAGAPIAGSNVTLNGDLAADINGYTFIGGILQSNNNIIGGGILTLSGTTGTTSIAAGQGLTVGGSQLVVQQGSGNVGIGTTNPGSALDVQGVADAQSFTATSTTVASQFPYASTTIITLKGSTSGLTTLQAPATGGAVEMFPSYGGTLVTNGVNSNQTFFNTETFAGTLAVTGAGYFTSNVGVGTTSPYWPAPGSEDTELGVLMEPEVCHGATEVYARVQA